MRVPVPIRVFPSSTEPRSMMTSGAISTRSEEHTSELQSLRHLVCRLLLEKKKNKCEITPAEIVIIPLTDGKASLGTFIQGLLLLLKAKPLLWKPVDAADDYCDSSRERCH